VLVPHDCVYDRSAVSHAVNLFDMSEKYADVVSSGEAIERLRAIAPREAHREAAAPRMRA
jgi:maleamate amidohydrolase